ncbi:hypothetical protein HZS_7383 [Henneguya salminicola]|nr:hypothetical protein HZS_7383 [Henneguya salminicola]
MLQNKQVRKFVKNTRHRIKLQRILGFIIKFSQDTNGINVFYPDLTDKTKRPQYSLTPSKEDPDSAILTFSGGPPYDVSCSFFKSSDNVLVFTKILKCSNGYLKHRYPRNACARLIE